MKRYILKTVFIFALILCLFALASCGGESVPETATETESETLTLSWESVSMTETETDSETATETETETETDTDTETETETETAEAPVVTESETEEEPPAPSVPSYDVTPPFFHYFVSKVTVYRGGDFELDKYISYIDDYDADVELTVAGRVNTSVSGEYILTLTLTDDAGNSSSSNMYVTVKDYVPPTTTTPSTPATPEPPMTFAEFTSIYKKNGASVGIDVSRWQGEIDFNKVAQAGCEFVIMRIGGYDDGVFEDMRFAENIKKAKAAGLKIGVYWYSEENSAALVRQDADYLYSLLGGEALDFPIFFDWEDFLHFHKYKMSMHDLNDMFAAFRDEAEKRGYKAALYNSKYYLGALWYDTSKTGGVWLAHYVDETNYTGDYFLWQQGIGRIDGIDADVDLDVFYPWKMKM